MGVNTVSICGEFEDPEEADKGQCGSFRLKIQCDGPALPQAPCGDEVYTIEYNPNLSPKFRVISTVFDDLCEAIRDHNNLSITGNYS